MRSRERERGTKTERGREVRKEKKERDKEKERKKERSKERKRQRKKEEKRKKFFKVVVLEMLWGQAPWLTPVIPTLWEAEMGESRGQEFETSLINKVKPYLH